MSLNDVEYLEINYESENPQPNYKTGFGEIDTVDFSIIFHTDRSKVEFYWDGQFYQFGIGVRFDEADEVATGQKWNVSKTTLWEKFIGEKITHVQLSWEEITSHWDNPSKSQKHIYPQYITIHFGMSKSIFISAAGFFNEGDKEVRGFSDNLIVTDNESLARKVKMIS